MTAYVFPGQGAQFTGMGKDLYDASPKAKALIDSACDILGFDIRNIMFTGSADDLKQTKVTQPAVFIHSVAAAATIEDFRPDMTAGHSLGEFSALVAAGAMSFEDGLRLVYARAMAMQKACEANPRLWLQSSACRTIPWKRCVPRQMVWWYRPITTVPDSWSYPGRQML